MVGIDLTNRFIASKRKQLGLRNLSNDEIEFVLRRKGVFTKKFQLKKLGKSLRDPSLSAGAGASLIRGVNQIPLDKQITKLDVAKQLGNVKLSRKFGLI